MAVDIEDFDAELNAKTLERLGDTITYTRQGAAAQTLKAIVDYGDNVERLGSSGVVQGECAIEVAKADVPLPDGADVIDLPKRPGVRFAPKDFKLDESGDNWLIALKRKPE